MTFENAVKKIREKFAEADASKLADMAVQVTLTDEDCGGTLYFKAENGAVDVQGYDYRDNDAVIDIERKALMDILAGKIDLDKAVEKGQATVKGNFEKLDTLKAAIKKHVSAPKKAVAKKPAAKKAEAKPAAKKAEAKAAVKAEAKPVAKKATAKKTEAKAAVKKPAAKKA